MSADKQLKAYIDRVLRLKEEQDTLGDDIREVYAEAKSEGYDKTIMGKLVAHLRKVAKSGEDAVSEQEMNFDTYLQAYHRASGTAVATHTHEEKSERIDPLTGEFLDDAPVTIIDRTDADGHHIKVTVDPEIAAILARVEAERSAAGLDIDGSVAAKEHRSDGGLDIVTKHTEIASTSQGEAEVHSDERETDREAAATGVGANKGGDDVDGGAVRADHCDQEELEPTGPVAEWATDLADDGIRYEASPPRPMKSLPYAACFPELSHAHYQQLSDSIANNGVREPIVRMGDVIVDGWSRYNISRSLGIEYPVVSYLGDDVLLDVIAWQREARQFTPVQERQIAARLAKEVPHRASEIMRAFQIEEEFA
ncbi:GapR family DNA-binding domain-containing protein [Ensifer sp. OTU672]|uniref:GapR family DNA-binding domain-containing protein n=1 Tax=Ensifer sp. OTU672 TaxID=3043861 RepID=UPI00313DE9CB